MKRIVSCILAALCGLCASAQSNIESLLGQMDSCRVEAAFSCRVKAAAPLDLTGTVVAQGSCFVMKANGIEAWCDGAALVLLDTEHKEAYVESAAGLRDFLKTNIGTLSDLKIKDTKVSGKKEDAGGEFRFDLKSLDSSWVITDMRQ